MGVGECASERMGVNERVDEGVDRAEMNMKPEPTYPPSPINTHNQPHTCESSSLLRGSVVSPKSLLSG